MYTDKGDLYPCSLLDDIGVKDGFAVVGEIAANVREIRLFGKLKIVIHAVVKFVVSGDGNVIFKVVHQ